MRKPSFDPDSFDQLDELVDTFLRTVRQPGAHANLMKLMAEAELIVACVDRMDELIQIMEKKETGIVLPTTWVSNREEQIRALYSGCDDLIEVVTEILPVKVVSVVKPFLN